MARVIDDKVCTIYVVSYNDTLLNIIEPSLLRKQKYHCVSISFALVNFILPQVTISLQIKTESRKAFCLCLLGADGGLVYVTKSYILGGQ